MSPIVQIGIALGSVIVLLGLMALVRARGKAAGWSAEVQRKLVHIGTGLYALTLPWLFTDDWPVYLLIAVTLVVMAVIRLPIFSKSGIGAALHGVERKSHGDFLLAIAVGMVFFYAGGDPLLYVLPIAVLTLSDAAAALAGSSYGRRFFPIEDGQKSVEGSAIFFLVTLLISMICLLLLSDVARANVVFISFVVAAFATLVEADSWRGYDNLFLPLGLVIFLAANLARPPIEVGFLVAAFAIGFLFFRALARLFGLTAHEARVYLMAVFLLLSVTAIQNTILPIIAIAVQIWTQKRHPSQDAYPYLDSIAAIALVSFGWLILGEATGFNALSFYGLSAIGLILSLVILGSSSSAVALRFALPAMAIVGLLWLWVQLTALNPETTRWHDQPWLMVAGSLALPLLIPFLGPQVFARTRMIRLAMLASVGPLVGYVALCLMQRGA